MCNHWLWCKNRRQKFIRFQVWLNHMAHPYAKPSMPGVNITWIVRMFSRASCFWSIVNTSHYNILPRTMLNIFKYIYRLFFSLTCCWMKNQFASRDSICILNTFIMFEPQTTDGLFDSKQFLLVLYCGKFISVPSIHKYYYLFFYGKSVCYLSVLIKIFSYVKSKWKRVIWA